MENNRINILWIEDNPLLTERGEHDGTEKVENNGKVFLIPSMKSLKSDADYFNLKILQHPEEIREYLAMCNKVVETKGANYLSLADGVIPDIVVFDYMLNENFNTTGKHCISYAAVMKPIREMFNPAYLFLKDEFADVFGMYVLFPERGSNYTDEELFHRINYDEEKKATKTVKKDITNTKDDEFGLYAGVSVVRFFKDHITCGLPATFNKKDRGSLQPTAKYFEWLNGYDLENALQRENKGNKNWKNVLSDGAVLLRKRIESQLATGKIVLNLSQLINFLDDNIPGKLDSPIFTFQSSYGVRHLPLLGLFNDVDAGKRNEAITKWAKTLLKLYKVDAYKTAKKVSEVLIKAHKCTAIINNRIRLSELVVKLANNEILTTNENTELSALKAEFGINDNQINEAREDKSVDIQNKSRDYRDFKTKDNQTNRLIILFTDLQLHFARQKFCEMNNKSTDEVGILSLLSSEPTLDDLRTALYPIPKNPLILPYHYHLLNDKTKFKKKEPFDAWEKPIGRDMANDAIYSKGDYPKNLSEGEIDLCKSFSLYLGLKVDYYPKWLTKRLLK